MEAHMIRIAITDRRGFAGVILLSAIVVLLALSPRAQAAPDALLTQALNKPSADLSQWTYQRKVSVRAMGADRATTTERWDGRTWVSLDPKVKETSSSQMMEYRDLKEVVPADAVKISETPTQAVFRFKTQNSGNFHIDVDIEAGADQQLDGWAYVRKTGVGAPYIYGILLALPQELNAGVADVKTMRLGFGFQPDPDGKTMLPRSFGLTVRVKALMFVNVDTDISSRSTGFAPVTR
jgi:hypothetical protein